MKRVLFYYAKMAEASVAMRAKKIPDNLYELCLTTLVNYLQKFKCERNDLRCLPDTILMDVYYKVSLNFVIYSKNISYYRYKLECFLHYPRSAKQ